MSHLGRYKTAITEANKDIAKLSFDVFCKHFGYEQAKNFTNVFGQTMNSTIGVTRSIAHGFAVTITKDGKLEILGDSWGKTKEFKEAIEMYEMVYKATALNLALRKKNYNVKVNMDLLAEKKVIQLVGVN